MSTHENENEKPVAQMLGANGNVFNLLAIATRALKEAGRADQANEMFERVTGGEAADYAHALLIMGEYVEIE